MAEENAVDNAEETEVPKKNKLKLIVLTSTVLLLGVGGFLGWKWYDGRKVEEETAQAEEAKTITYPLKSFIVNLTDKKGVGKRYLKITMEVEVDGEQQRSLVNNHVPQLRDTILLLLSSRNIDEITTMEAKLELKQLLLARMNRAIGQSVIQRVYFTEFVVQ